MNYRILFVVNFLVIVLQMKFISWWLCPPHKRPPLLVFLFTTPLLSARVAKSSYQRFPFGLLAIKLTLALTFLALLILVARFFLSPLGMGEIILLAPMIYFLTEAMGSFAQLLFYPWTQVPPIHRHPLSAKTLGEFWGKHWNIWVQDWLRDVSRWQRKNLKAKLFITFGASGLFHELMVNLPLAVMSGKSYFGNMILYFATQGLGLWFEKRWGSRFSLRVRRVYLWAIILLPSPLFLSPPLLIFFGIGHE